MRMLEKFELHSQDVAARKTFDETFKTMYPDLYLGSSGDPLNQRGGRDNDFCKALKEVGWELYSAQACVDRTIDFLINHLKIIENNFQLLNLRVAEIEKFNIELRKAVVEREAARRKAKKGSKSKKAKKALPQPKKAVKA